MKFSAILTVEAAMAAVTRNGDALRYVLCKELFIKMAGILKIEIEI